MSEQRYKWATDGRRNWVADTHDGDQELCALTCVDSLNSLTAENAALRERLVEAERLLKALRLGLRDHSDAAMATDAFLARDTEKNDA